METPLLTPSLAELRSRLPGLAPRDRQRLGRRADSAAALRDAKPREQALARLNAEIEAAAARVEERRGAVPAIAYPPELPVSQRKAEIAAAIRDHQVVIVAGETGSGKTTQLPKICLELGRGVAGQIGHTQPRRIAARTVAERIADELGTEVGTAVGYKVRFTDKSSDGTFIKVMTDGILLTEMQRDRQLLRYDTLIIDEAHERSLNIDFILGYLKQLLPAGRISRSSSRRRRSTRSGSRSISVRRPRRSSRCPAGRTRSRSGTGRWPTPTGPRDEPRDQAQGICDAIAELRRDGPGDVLVFLSGEREIRDTADALADGGPTDLEVLPLFARLSAAEQHRVFQPHHRRRVVLATNMAETSLTVPGIRYVIDPGTARISRYSQRTKVQRLPIERISRASANQRRAGAGGPPTASASGCTARRTSLPAGVHRPGDPAHQPGRGHPADGRARPRRRWRTSRSWTRLTPATSPTASALLEELGAVPPRPAAATRLTGDGPKLARLPADPRLGRMILEAGATGACPRC